MHIKLELRKLLDYTILVLAVVGLGTSIYLLLFKYSLVPCLPGSTTNVNPNNNLQVSCNAVVNSAQPVAIFGINIVYYGIGFFAILLLLGSWKLRSKVKNEVRALTLLILGWAIVGAAGAAYLIYLELYVLYAICPICTIAHVVAFAVLGAAIVQMLNVYKLNRTR